MNRCAIAVVFMCAWTLAAAQTSLDACLKKVEMDGRFAQLAAKMGAGAGDQSLATNKEQQLIKSWIAARSVCLESAEGNAAYRPPLTAYAVDAEQKLLASVAELAGQKISFGEFSRRRTAIEAERQNRTAALNHRIRDQSAAFETDQRARELQQVQKDLDEAERQASLAQQEVARMEARRAQYAQRYRAPPAPVVQHVESFGYRNCWNAGGRIVCARR